MYYVYKLIDPRDNKIFYVGKGSGDRAYVHQIFRDSNKNNHKDNKIRQIQSEGSDVIVEFEYTGLTDEQEAYDLETALIESIGIDNLTNICMGSNPPSRKGSTLVFTEQHKKNLSKALKGKKKSTPPWNKGKTTQNDKRVAQSAEKRSQVGNCHQIGKKRNPKTIEKIKEKLTGRKMTAEQKSKMKKAKKGKTWEEIYGVEGARERRDRLKEKKQLRTAGMEDIVIS